MMCPETRRATFFETDFSESGSHALVFRRCHAVGNPILFSDPSGLVAVTVGLGGSITAGVGGTAERGIILTDSNYSTSMVGYGGTYKYLGMASGWGVAGGVAVTLYPGSGPNAVAESNSQFNISFPLITITFPLNNYGPAGIGVIIGASSWGAGIAATPTTVNPKKIPHLLHPWTALNDYQTALSSSIGKNVSVGFYRRTDIARFIRQSGQLFYKSCRPNYYLHRKDRILLSLSKMQKLFIRRRFKYSRNASGYLLNPSPVSM